LRVGNLRLVAERGFNLTLRGGQYQARRIQAYLRFANNAIVPAVLDTGAYFSFLPEHVWGSFLPSEDRQAADPDTLLWYPEATAYPTSCPPGTARFETTLHRGRGVGSSPDQAIRCLFTVVRACIQDSWGGDSGWLQIPMLLGQTAQLRRDQTPPDPLLGFAGILDRATLHFDYRSRTMTLDFPD